MSKQKPVKAKTSRASASSQRAAPPNENGELIVVGSREAFVHAKKVDWPANFPNHDDEIDLSDIPEQDFGERNIIRGRYRELALAAQGFVQLDSDIRTAFPDTQSVNSALRALLRQQRKRKNS